MPIARLVRTSSSVCDGHLVTGFHAGVPGQTLAPQSALDVLLCSIEEALPSLVLGMRANVRRGWCNVRGNM